MASRQSTTMAAGLHWSTECCCKALEGHVSLPAPSMVLLVVSVDQGGSQAGMEQIRVATISETPGPAQTSAWQAPLCDSGYVAGIALKSRIRDHKANLSLTSAQNAANTASAATSSE